jgi:hypothetical protein
MASRFWVGGTGTWDGSDTTHWAATSGGAGGQSVPGSADTVTLDGSSGGGTVTVNTTVNVVSLTMGAFTGTLDFATNNNNVTLQTFNGSGTGTRTLNMGAGSWTITAATGSAVWDLSTPTNLTFNCNTSTLTFTGLNGYIIETGGLTYNNVTIGAKTGSAGTQLAGGGTIANLAITAPNYIQGALNVTFTLSNAPTWVGTSATPLIITNNTYVNTVPVTFAISAGTPSLTWCVLRGVKFTGSVGTANNSLSGGEVTGITVNPPSGSGGGCRIAGHGGLAA